MDLTKVNNQFEAAREKRKEAIIMAFDGRTQQFICEKTGVDAVKFNRWINGFGGLEDTDITKLEKYLGVDFK